MCGHRARYMGMHVGRTGPDPQTNTIIVFLAPLTLFITLRESDMGTKEHQCHALGDDQILSNDLAPAHQV